MNLHISAIDNLSTREAKGCNAYARLYGCGGDVLEIIDAAMHRKMPAGVGVKTRHGIIAKLVAQVMFERIKVGAIK